MANIKKALITGSAGLVGAQAAEFFIGRGYEVTGIDNDLRGYFFGREASTQWNKTRLEEKFRDKYRHYPIDIRDAQALRELFKTNCFEIIIHAAGQPSHDWAAKEPLTDFGVNAQGTLLMLENLRHYCPEAAFIFTSTNKVYGDRPNFLPLTELEKRYEPALEHRYYNGIDETMSIDYCTHSLFGASKLAADVLVQEYGRYFGLKTGVFRAGCISGAGHSPAKLHGFLAYLVKCIARGDTYTILGYKGKQVRDNIHSFDLVNMFWHFHNNPRPGEVYNAGGSRHSNVSILEAIEKIERGLGRKARTVYDPRPRTGDHIWYISDVSKFKSHYPQWDYTYDIDRIIEDLCRREFSCGDVRT